VRCLLVRRLRTRRNDSALLAEPRARGAVAEREDVVVARRLQPRADDELVYSISLEPVEIAQENGRLHAGRPHRQLRGNDLSSREQYAIG
jgi:hypothetical protein